MVADFFVQLYRPLYWVLWSLCQAKETIPAILTGPINIKELFIGYRNTEKPKREP